MTAELLLIHHLKLLFLAVWLYRLELTRTSYLQQVLDEHSREYFESIPFADFDTGDDKMHFSTTFTESLPCKVA